MYGVGSKAPGTLKLEFKIQKISDGLIMKAYLCCIRQVDGLHTWEGSVSQNSVARESREWMTVNKRKSVIGVIHFR